MSKRTYERITDRIVALMSRGTVPWHKPWKARTGLPRNLVTRKPYRGVNVFLLLALNYESPFWLTFRQALRLGGMVKKGEKACPVVFWKAKTVTDKKTGDEKAIRLLRFYHVFNVAQCEGLKEAPPAAGTGGMGLSVKPAEIVRNMPLAPVIKHGMACALYSPREDIVGMPDQEQFNREEHYYSTLFHELIHSTGHESRLKRATLLGASGFGTDPYCKEELIAELGAAFLCGHADIVERTIDNSAAYLAGWLARLQSDPTLIVQAAAGAQRAADFVLNLAEEPEAATRGRPAAEVS